MDFNIRLVTFELVREGYIDIITLKLKVDILKVIEDTLKTLKAELDKLQCPGCMLTLNALFDDTSSDKENEPPLEDELTLEDLVDSRMRVGCS
ncbi:hypothetical protein GGI16_005479, partial [Coemansia sp. S142-1]